MVLSEHLPLPGIRTPDPPAPSPKVLSMWPPCWSQGLGRWFRFKVGLHLQCATWFSEKMADVLPFFIQLLNTNIYFFFIFILINSLYVSVFFTYTYKNHTHTFRKIFFLNSIWRAYCRRYNDRITLRVLLYCWEYCCTLRVLHDVFQRWYCVD